MNLFELFIERKYFLCFSKGVTFLERTLGDVIFSQLPNPSEELVPNKLSEILLHPLISQSLGEDILFILRTMIGPLNGLNLRNVIWHGFVTYEEFSPNYTSFFLVLLLSLSTPILSNLIQRRKLFDVPQLIQGSTYSISPNILNGGFFIQLNLTYIFI